MTLTTLGTVNRLYAEQTPGWQRFQPKLLTNSTALNASTASSHPQQQQQHPYQKQYSHVYYQRLMMLSPMIWNRMRNDDSSSSSSSDSNTVQHTSRILELPEEALCSCVGTLIMERTDAIISSSSVKEEEDDEDMIMKELNNSRNNTTQCQYYLEDESGRVSLNLSKYWNDRDTSATQPSASDVPDDEAIVDLCNGVVIGVIGIVGIDGIMQVQKVYTAVTAHDITLDPTGSAAASSIFASLPLSVTTPCNNNNQPYLMLLSGLNCGRPTSDSTISRDMLLSYLQGAFPHSNSKAKSVVHVIVAGGLIYNNDVTATTSSSNSDDDENDSISSTSNGCYDLDIFCYQITKMTGIPISLLPGQNDPTTANWPQRPLHSSLLPNTSSASSSQLLHRCPNPYVATFSVVNDNHNQDQDCTSFSDDSNTNLQQPHRHCNVVGTDGLNVTDWVEQTKRNRGSNNKKSNYTELQALHATLTHQHLCPTGPDTVPTAPPQHEIDPMVMTMMTKSSNQPTTPIIYFAGNCSKFQTKLVSVTADTTTATTSISSIVEPTSGTTAARLICIPKFSDSYIAVLVNLVTLQVELLQFQG